MIDEPCDGCAHRATHALCDRCLHEDVERLERQLAEARAECERQMQYGIQQHEVAQDAVRQRDEALASATRGWEMADSLHRDVAQYRSAVDAVLAVIWQQTRDGETYSLSALGERVRRLLQQAETSVAALKAKIAQMLDDEGMACETPPKGCECAGCSYARERAKEGRL